MPAKTSMARNRARILAGLMLAATLLLQLSCTARRPTTIRLAGDKWFLTSLVKTGLLADFEKHSGIHVDIIYKNDEAIMRDLDGSAAGAQRYDVVVMRHRFLGALVAKQQVQPIEGYLSDRALHDNGFVPEEQLYSNWWHGLASYRGHAYGYPFTGLTTYLCYRKDMLDDAENQRRYKARYHQELKPPATWEQYARVAAFFTRPDEHFYGTYVQGKQGLALWYEWLSFIYAFGGDILDTRHGSEYGDIVVNSPENVAATEEYVSLIKSSPPDTLSYGWNEAQSALQQGHVYMGILWSDQAPFLEDASVSKVAGKIGYRLLPSDTGSPVSQMEGLISLLPANASHPKEAYRWMEWATSSTVQIQQTLHGGGSLRRSTYDDAGVQALPYTPTFLKSLPVAREKPTIPESDEITRRAEVRLSDAVRGKSTPKAALDGLALDLQQILGHRGRLKFAVTTTP